MKLSNIISTIEALTPEQIAKAKELGLYLKDTMPAMNGPQIPLGLLWDICCNIYQVKPEEIKGRLKPDNLIDQRGAQNAFLWAAVWFSNAYSSDIANYLGCRSSSVYNAARQHFYGIRCYAEESGRYKYHQQRYTRSCRFLLVAWACYSLCPDRYKLDTNKRDLHKDKKDWAADIQKSLQETQKTLEKAAQLQAESSLIDADTRRQLQRIIRRMELDKKDPAQLTYAEYFIKNFDLDAPIEKGVYMETETLTRLSGLRRSWFAGN